MARGRPTKTTRQAWIAAAVEVLAEAGVEAVRVEAVARRLGVTKGGFYGHFADRQALLTALVEAWEQQGTEAIISAVDEVEGGAEARAEELWRQATRDDMGGELAIRDWARRDEAVRAVVERVDERRMGYLRALFGELGFRGLDREARCLLVYSLLIGDHFIATGHGKLAREKVLRACRELLRTRAGT